MVLENQSIKFSKREPKDYGKDSWDHIFGTNPELTPTSGMAQMWSLWDFSRLLHLSSSEQRRPFTLLFWRQN